MADKDEFKEVLEVFKQYIDNKIDEVKDFVNENPGEFMGWNKQFVPINLEDYLKKAPQMMIFKGLIQQYGTYLAGYKWIVEERIKEFEEYIERLDIPSETKENFTTVILSVYESIGINPCEEVSTGIIEDDPALEEIIDSEPIDLELQERILKEDSVYQQTILEKEEELTAEEKKNNMATLLSTIRIDYEKLEEAPAKIKAKTTEIRDKYDQRIEKIREINKEIDKRIKINKDILIKLRKRGFI